MIKNLKIILVVLLLSASMYGADSDYFATYHNARVHSSADAFSSQVGRITFGTPVQVLETKNLWLKVKTNSVTGYVHSDGIIDKDGFNRQSKAISEEEAKQGKKGFNAEDVTAGTKGFSADDVSAGTKGFGAEDVTAGAKGFNEDVEKKYKQENQGYRYDLVDQIDRNGEINNIQSSYYGFRQEGKLGEFNSYRSAGN